MPAPTAPRLRAPAAVTAAVFLVACSTTTYQVAGYDRRYTREVFVPTDAVVEYRKGSPPLRPYRVIGAIEIAGGPDTDSRDLLEAAAARARAMGAHALVDIEILREEPQYVRANATTRPDAGKTLAAVLGAVVVVGIIIVALAIAGSAGRSHADDDDDESDHESVHGPPRTRSRSSRRTGPLVVRVLRAQAARFGNPGDASVEPADVSSDFTRVRSWLVSAVTERREELLACVGAAGEVPEVFEARLGVDIGVHGRVLHATIYEPDPDLDPIVSCIEQTVERLGGAPPTGGRRVTVGIPLRIETPPTGAPQLTAGSLDGARSRGNGRPRRSVFLLGLQPATPAEVGIARAATDLLAVELAGHATIRVQTVDDVEAALHAELEKDLLGCSDVACAAEVGAALDADFICYGNVAALEEERAFSGFIVTPEGSQVARAVVIASLEDDLRRAVGTLARELTLQLHSNGDDEAPSGGQDAAAPP